nr:uncharacterized protein LOC124807929 isoform X2 [Hydra vulgaris]
MNKQEKNQYLREWRQNSQALNNILVNEEINNSSHVKSNIIEVESFKSDQDSEVPLNDVNKDLNDGVLVTEIVKWTLKHRITRNASDKLLFLILHQYGHHVDLPKCARTILNTPRNVPIVNGLPLFKSSNTQAYIIYI